MTAVWGGAGGLQLGTPVGGETVSVRRNLHFFLWVVSLSWPTAEVCSTQANTVGLSLC